MELKPEDTRAIVIRLNRAQGQIGGIVKMLESGRSCQEIVTQLAAVSKALDRAGFAVIAAGLRECLNDPNQSGADIDQIEKLFLSLA